MSLFQQNYTTTTTSAASHHSPTTPSAATITTTTTTKRKHFDEETQCYADEEESWKKIRWNDCPKDNDDDDDNVMMTTTTSMSIEPPTWEGRNGSQVTMTTTPSSLSLSDPYGHYQNDCNNKNNIINGYSCSTNNVERDSTHHMDSKQIVSTMTTPTKKKQQEQDQESSWSMFHSKELRQRQSPGKSFEARRDMVKLWRIQSPTMLNVVANEMKLEWEFENGRR